jgi:hypothetical protein
LRFAVNPETILAHFEESKWISRKIGVSSQGFPSEGAVEEEYVRQIGKLPKTLGGIGRGNELMNERETDRRGAGYRWAMPFGMPW